MTVPLDTRQDIREMDAWGVPRAEIARDLDLSRNTVRKYADQEDLSPKPPIPGERARPSTDPYADWIDSVLEADLGMPRKQRHTAKRIYHRLVRERDVFRQAFLSHQRHLLLSHGVTASAPPSYPVA